jgi:hypothetical protein
MTFLQTLKAVFTRPWFVRGDRYEYAKACSKPVTDPFENDPFFGTDDRARELRLLNHRIENVREMMMKAKAQKKKWKHLEARWNQLLCRRASLSGTS